MKKVFIAIISIILVCLLGLGIMGHYVEKSKQEEKNNKKVEESITNNKNEENKLVINSDKLDITKIKGYTEGQIVENQENKTIGGINLPYSVPDKSMEIVSIGKYSGKFIEDGSDEKKDNILAMVIKNTSKETINYGQIIMKISGGTNIIEFEVTNLKPGYSALVMEATGTVKFNENDQYKYLDSTSEMEKTLSLMDKEIKITTEDKKITIKNLTNKDLNTVYVYYKTISPGNCYLGGLTYRAKFEKVKANKTVSVKTSHFSKTTSEILKVETSQKQ